MIEQLDADETISRVATAAIAYYPGVEDDDPKFSLDEETGWCIEPLGPLTGAQRSALGDIVGRTIVDPTANRQDLFAAILELTSD